MIIYDKNNIERCEIKSLEYNGEFMGERFLSATIKSPFPIDFELGDYIDYRGERFTLNYDPSIIKKAEIYKSGESFTYENVKFNSYADELLRCEFLDYVLNDNLIHFSSLSTFGFHALTIQDLADRIKANLDRVYPGLWTVNVDSDVDVKNVFISADKLTVWGALALVSTTFKSNFIIRGRTITIGTAGNVIDNVFEYGKGKGLNKITKIADSEQQIITRLRVYGSTRNLPLRYYNKLTSPLPSNMAVQNLMLPSFPYSTLDPYLDSPNIGELGVMEGSVFFDGSNDLPEIYPSLEGMTASELISAGIPVSLDPGDNGNLDEIVSITNEDGTPITDDGLFEEGETVPPFKLTIKDIGFDINDYLSGETATISLKTGMNGGREFEILSCEKAGNKYILTCNRVEDVGRFFPYSLMNIKEGDKFVLLNIEMPEVYIKAASQRLLVAGQEYLSKNDYVRYTYQVNISPVYMARNPIDLIEGDYLLFTDTDLGISGSIIIDTLRIKDDGTPTYEVTLTEEKQVGTLQKLQNQINYLLSGSIGGSVDIKQVESLVRLIGAREFISKTKDLLKSTDTETALTDENVLSSLRILLEIDKNNETFLEDLKEQFLSKVEDDTAQGVITFLKGIIASDLSTFTDLIASGKIIAEDIDVKNHLLTNTLKVILQADLQTILLRGQMNSETFASGFLGHGMRLRKNGDDWELELDKITVRKSMTVYELIVQELRYQAGQHIYGPAGAKLTKVTDNGSYWRCEHDGTMDFITGSQVLCQKFKVGSKAENPDGLQTYKDARIKRYWRLVTGYGSGWFNLSKADCEIGSGTPEIDDQVAVLGHRTNPDWQNAIMLVSTGSDAPYTAYYAGINSYSTVGKEVIREGNLNGIVDAQFGQLRGHGLYGENVYLKGQFRLNNSKLIEDAINDAYKQEHIGALNLLREYDARFDFKYWGETGEKVEVDFNTINPYKVMILCDRDNVIVTEDNLAIKIIL